MAGPPRRWIAPSTPRPAGVVQGTARGSGALDATWPSFESSVGDFLRQEANRLGDLYEAVGTTMGEIDRRTGDHVLTLGSQSGAPEARIVCEAKAKKGYTERNALEKIARARKNRDARVGLVIMARALAPEGMEPVRRIGDDVLVVWDADDVASDLALRLAVSVARALCVRERIASSVIRVAEHGKAEWLLEYFANALVHLAQKLGPKSRLRLLIAESR